MVISHSNEASLQKKAASRDLLTYFLSALSCLDACENTKSGCYLVPSLHYKFIVNGILKDSIKKMSLRIK